MVGFLTFLYYNIIINAEVYKMKKCVNCGCHNQDTRVICADCGLTLIGAEKISEEELREKLDKLSRYSDPFSFKPRHKIIFYASLSLIVINIFLIIFKLIQSEFIIVTILCFISSLISARFSEFLWNIEKFSLQFKVSGDIEPSDWWFISREITMFMGFGFGVMSFLYTLI